MKGFTIIIPTLNEEKNVLPLLQRISSMAQASGLRPEVIFVDDDSTDETCARIESFSSELYIRLIKRRNERGLASAVTWGCREAMYDHVLVMDGDLSHEPESIPDIVRPLLNGKADIVVGSRYSEGGTIIGWPARRKMLSKLATLPAHWLTGVEDPLSGFFAVKKGLITGMTEKTKGFKILFDLLRLHGNELRIQEMPICFSDRNHGTSKLNRGVGLAYLGQLFNSFGFFPSGCGSAAHLISAVTAASLDSAVFFWLVNMGISLGAAHISSLTMTGVLFLLLGAGFLAADNNQASGRPLRTILSRLLVVLTAVLFLRGGLLALLESHNTGLPAEAAFLGLFTAATWYFFAATPRRPSVSLPPGAIAISIIVYTLLLRLLYLGSIELIQEEAYYWNYAQHMAPGYLDHPPLVAVLIWIGTTLLGDTEFAVRLGAYLCWFITAFYAHALSRRMYGAATARYAVLIIAVLPIFFGAALVMTPDAPLIASWSATLYYIYRALVDEHKYSWIWLGLAFGVGLLSKYTIILLVPSVLIFMILDRRSRRWLKTPMPYAAVFAAIVVFLPVLWWNMENGWASFLFQSKDRLAETAMFTTHRLAFFVLLLLTPTGILAALLSLLPNIFKKSDGSKNDKSLRQYLFTLLTVLLPLSVFVFASLFREVKLNWTGPLWLATVPFMALTLAAAFEGKTLGGKTAILLAGSWLKTIFSLIVVYGISLHYLSIGLPGVPYIKNTILLGWDNLAARVEEKVDEVERDLGSTPVVVGMDRYRIASGIAFYRRKTAGVQDTADIDPPQTTGRHLFGLNSLMFQYWHPITLFSRRDLFAVAHSRDMLHPDYFQGRAQEVGTVQTLTVEKQGRKVATYYYRLLKGYQLADQPDIAAYETGSVTN